MRRAQVRERPQDHHDDIGQVVVPENRHLLERVVQRLAALQLLEEVLDQPPVVVERPFLALHVFLVVVAFSELSVERADQFGIPCPAQFACGRVVVHRVAVRDDADDAVLDEFGAAPTAGLHFTKELLEKIEKKGIKIVDIFLEVGLGTFRPVQTENVLEHKMHEEVYEIPQEAADIINEGKKNGKRIISVGTTSTRALESAVDENGLVKALKGSTEIFIYPGFEFKVIDALITNFHLPKSTLLMLVSALSSREFMLKVYDIAVKEEYHFFSFGDAMFIY